MKAVVGFGWIFMALGLGGAAVGGTTSSGPPAPQQQGQFDAYRDGQPSEPSSMAVVNSVTAGANDRFAAIVPGDSLYVDPQGGNFTTPGPARYITSASSVPAAVKIPLATPAQWQNFYSGTQTGTPPPGITAIVACRPATPTLNSATMCNDGGTATSVTEVNGAGTNGYGQLGSTGTATATCSNPPYGTYEVTVPFNCGATGSGVTADGQWVEASASGDSDICTANSYTSGCSAICPTTAGTTSTFDSCGQLKGSNPCSISCCVPNGSCSGECGGGPGVDNCGNACTNNAECPPPPPPAEQCSCHAEPYTCLDNIRHFDDCGGDNGGSCADGGSEGASTWSCKPGTCTSCQCVDKYSDDGCTTQSSCCHETGTCC